MTAAPAVPRRVDGGDAQAVAEALALVRAAFAYMDGVVDPASSIHRMALADMAAHAARGELWAAGTPPVACAIFTRKRDALYIGKLAVAGDRRGQGLARALFDAAEAEARRLGLGWLELQTRVELTANHATFARLGFTETGRSAHPGYDRPTSLTFRRPVPAG